MTVIHLVRHGETNLNAQDRYSGRADAPLNDTGRLQAAALGAWAATREISRIVVSPTSRARMSAGPAATATGLSIIVDERWSEVDFGRAEGLERAELMRRFPAEYAAFVASPADVPLPGGEAGRDAIGRLRAAFDDAAASAPEVLVVGHSTAFRLLLCDQLGIDPNRYRTVFPHLENGGVTTLDARDAGLALRTFNAPLSSTHPA